MIRDNIIIVIAVWISGFLIGCAIGYQECRAPQRVRYSYVDTTPPPCAFQPTRDKRHVCEWERARIK